MYIQLYSVYLFQYHEAIYDISSCRCVFYFNKGKQKKNIYQWIEVFCLTSYANRTDILFHIALRSCSFKISNKILLSHEKACMYLFPCLWRITVYFYKTRKTKFVKFLEISWSNYTVIIYYILHWQKML